MGPATVLLWRGADLFDLTQVELPRPGPGEVLVRVALTTVCGSDLHTVAGHRPGPTPSVLGHEAVGEVVRVGDGAPVRPGDRVVWGVGVACGTCDRCVTGRTAKCRTVRKLGHERFAGPWSLSGTYATHVLLPRGSTVVPVPAELDDATAAPAGCATATVMAAVEAAGPLAGRSVLVAGAGMLGIAATAAVTRAGAASVAVLDPDPHRRALATTFGATTTLTPGDPVPVVDAALELSGAASALATAYDALDVGGRLVLAGTVSPGPPLALDPEGLVRSWHTITGVHNYEPHHLHQALELLAETPHLPWAHLVAAPVALADGPRVLTHLSREHLRGSIRP